MIACVIAISTDDDDDRNETDDGQLTQRVRISGSGARVRRAGALGSVGGWKVGTKEGRKGGEEGKRLQWEADFDEID